MNDYYLCVLSLSVFYEFCSLMFHFSVTGGDSIKYLFQGTCFATEAMLSFSKIKCCKLIVLRYWVSALTVLQPTFFFTKNVLLFLSLIFL